MRAQLELYGQPGIPKRMLVRDNEDRRLSVTEWSGDKTLE